MKTKSRKWSIDFHSGHCKHLDGLDAYIGHSGSKHFIPLLGPYSQRTFKESDIAVAIGELTQALENSDRSRVVTWGSLDNSRSGKEISVLGLEQYWTPDPSARTNWLRMCRSQTDSTQYRTELSRSIEKEWILSPNPNQITHLSNVGFSFDKTCFDGDFTRMISDPSASTFLAGDPDTTILHPLLLRDSIHALAKVAFHVLADANQADCVSKTIRLDIDLPANALNL